MPFLYDNMVATVIAMTVVLILISIQMRASSSNLARSGRNQALNEAKTMAAWIEEDLESMGKNIKKSETIFPALSRQASDHSPTGAVLQDLAFQYRATKSGPDTTVSYRVTDAFTKTVQGEDRTLYQLNRETDGSPTGGSGATLGYFDVHFLGPTAGRITSPNANRDKIEAVRAHFSVISPFQSDETTLHEVHRMVVVPYTPAQN